MSNFPLYEFACGCGTCDNKTKLILTQKLQSVRNYLNEPIIIVSGYRCEEHNANVGGSSTSSHLAGLAADIYIPDNFYRYRLIEAIVLSKAFTRYGTGDRNGVKTFHVDCDLSKPQRISWGY